MRDLPYWRNAIYNAKSPVELKSIGEDIAIYKNQTDFLSNEPRLTDNQVDILRRLFAEKMDEYQPPKHTHSK